MEALTLDTSGRVECAASFQPIGWAIWSDLSPFVQGYVEALLADYSNRLSAGLGEPLHVGFSDPAPETLALILKDCAAIRALHPSLEDTHGAIMWDVRALGRLTDKGFPPLTPTLADDGKVYLRSAA